MRGVPENMARTGKPTAVRLGGELCQGFFELEL